MTRDRPRPRWAVHVAAVAFAALAAATVGPVSATQLPPELRTAEVSSAHGVVVANTREAATAGARMLEAGGNAVDAAVAAALALGVSETEASGIGGSAWILIHLASGFEVALDGSASVPLKVAPAELQRLRDDGVNFGYKTIATPVALAALADALQRYGTKSFAETVAPAIEIADAGVRLPNVNDGYAGKAPDLGAYEVGEPVPHYGPRE